MVQRICFFPPCEGSSDGGANAGEEGEDGEEDVCECGRECGGERRADAEGVHGWWTPLVREKRHLGGYAVDKHARKSSRVGDHCGIEWTLVRHTQHRRWCYSCRREMTDTLLQLRDRGQPCCILSLSLSPSHRYIH